MDVLRGGGIYARRSQVRRCRCKTAGTAVELELAVSSVMGSGLFICCVSLAAVIFVQRIEIVPSDRCHFENSHNLWSVSLHASAKICTDTFTVYTILAILIKSAVPFLY